MENSVDFSVIINQSRLAEIFEKSIDHALTEEPLEVNSVSIRLTRVGKADIIPDGKNIHLTLPYKIDIMRSAGLFSIEGTGALHLELDIQYEISENLRIKSKTSLDSYNWIEKPVLEIGAINVPLEKIIGMVLNHYESVITGKIDSAIKEKANLQEPLSNAMKEVHERINNIDMKGTSTNIQIDNISLLPPQLDKSGDISIMGRATPIILVSELDVPYQYRPTKFNWMDRFAPIENQLEVYTDISYELISKIILEQIKGIEIGGKILVVDEINIAHYDDILRVKAAISSPLKAEAVVTCEPRYIPRTGELFLDKVDVKVHNSNILYKLTAPLVNNYIESKIDGMFPMIVEEVLNEKVIPQIPSSIDIPYGQMKILQKGFNVENIKFLMDRINAKINLRNIDILGTIS